MRRRIALAISATMLILPASGLSQTRSRRDAVTAYGGRLNAKGQSADLNSARINNRIPSRIDTRLNLRIERYYPDATQNPTAAFQTNNDDKSRTAPVITPQQPQVISDPYGQ